jgi:hypothetical protein
MADCQDELYKGVLWEGEGLREEDHDLNSWLVVESTKKLHAANHIHDRPSMHSH